MNFYELERRMRRDETFGAPMAQPAAAGASNFLNAQPFNPAKFANVKGYDAKMLQDLVTSFLGQFNISPESIKPELDALTKKATDTFVAVQQQKAQAVDGLFTPQQPGAAGTA